MNWRGWESSLETFAVAFTLKINIITAIFTNMKYGHQGMDKPAVQSVGPANIFNSCPSSYKHARDSGARGRREFQSMNVPSFRALARGPGDTRIIYALDTNFTARELDSAFSFAEIARTIQTIRGIFYTVAMMTMTMKIHFNTFGDPVRIGDAITYSSPLTMLFLLPVASTLASTVAMRFRRLSSLRLGGAR